MLSDSMRTLSGHLDTHEILAAKVSLLVPVAASPVISGWLGKSKLLNFK
jgi:hypothetical protein